MQLQISHCKSLKCALPLNHTLGESVDNNNATIKRKVKKNAGCPFGTAAVETISARNPDYTF